MSERQPRLRPARSLWLALALLLAATPLLRTQTLPWTDGSINLDAGWRIGAGDNPSFAQPAFDDRNWPLVDLRSRSDTAGWYWYRLRVSLPAQHPPLALLVTGGSGTYEVYLNGRRLPGSALRASVFITYPRSQMIPLPPTTGSTELALRSFIPPSSTFLADRGSLRVALGTLPALENAVISEQSGRFDAVALGIGIHALLLFAAIGSLLLFGYQRDHREYLWLGLYLALDAIGTPLYELALASFLPFSLSWFVATPSLYFAAIFQIEFTFSFAGQRITLPWRAYEALLLVPPFFLLVPAWLGFLSRGLFNVDEVLIILPAAILLPVLLSVWYRRGNHEAGWLILPSLLPMFTVALNDFGIIGDYLHWPRLAALSNPIPLGPLSIQSFDLGDFLFLLAIAIVMFFRFTRVSREQARSTAEFAAAREIQQHLVPASLPLVDRFRAAAVYLPAEEVGGDFYQLLPLPGSSALLVIGDVSGKGLRAAMTGALVLGALRALAQENLSPAQILSRLNIQLAAASDGGFVTCLAARMASDGSLALANAGHLAPYRNGEEVPLDSSLPLGITAEAVYSESTLRLAPGDSLTFVSDGVVEAQSPSGQLFGFERTRAISSQSATQIADAAQAHGQQDDITVLTLTFAGAAAPMVQPQ